MATKNAWNNTIADANVTLNGGTVAIGTDSADNDIDIGTAASAGRTIDIGNTTGTTALNLSCGTGDFSLTSATGTIMSAADTGEINYSLQPSFLATLAANREDVTGDGTVYTIAYGTEKFDQNADFDGNSTFTAPVTGRYRFEVGVLIDLTNTSSSANAGYCEIVTSNNTFRCSVGDPEGNDDAGDRLSLSGGVLCDMDAADTTITTVAVSNTTLQVDVVTNTPTNEPTYFSGNLVC